MRETRKVQNGREEEGWIPVIRNHRVLNASRAGNKETFTLFVDNIPDSKDQIWLKRTFNNFGIVRDAFIPRKRSQRTGKKFGFVRYDCHVAAGMAVSRMNGVWVENERLFVKQACFGHNEENTRVQHSRVHSVRELAPTQGVCPRQRPRKGVMEEVERVEPHGSFAGHGRSFVQAPKGESSKRGEDQKILLHVKPSANGWLDRSACGGSYAPSCIFDDIESEFQYGDKPSSSVSILRRKGCPNHVPKQRS